MLHVFLIANGGNAFPFNERKPWDRRKTSSVMNDASLIQTLSFVTTHFVRLSMARPRLRGGVAHPGIVNRFNAGIRTHVACFKSAHGRQLGPKYE